MTTTNDRARGAKLPCYLARPERPLSLCALLKGAVPECPTKLTLNIIGFFAHRSSSEASIPRISVLSDWDDYPVAMQVGRPVIDTKRANAVSAKRLRGKLDYTDIGFALLNERFTLRELQDVHEAILGVSI